MTTIHEIPSKPLAKAGVVLFSLCLFVCYGCFAGGAAPRKNAYAVLEAHYGKGLASRVVSGGYLEKGEIDKLIKLSDAGDQNVLFYILGNENISTDIQVDVVSRSSGWGLQGIGYNKRLYFSDTVKRIMAGKTDSMSKDMYRILYTENKGPYPLDLTEVKN